MHGDASLLLLLLFILGLLFAGPILALIAWRRVHRLEREQSDPSGDERHSALVLRIYALEQKLAQLQESLNRLSPAPPASPETLPPRPREVSPRPEVLPPPPPSEPSTPRRSAPIDLETLIAGPVLMRVGMLLVLIGMAYFLRYAFESNWIGPTGRVTLGLLSGTSLLTLSHWLLRRGYIYFSEGITALGGGILYLSLYAAWYYYELVPNAAAFLLMIVITGALLTVAVGRNSQRLAILGLAGGFLTPILVSTGRNAQFELFAYVAALDAGLLVIARLREWRTLEPLAFISTQLYFWGWYTRFYDSEPQLLSTMIFSGIFFLLFAVLPAIHNRRTARLFPEQIAVMLGNTFLYLAALRAILWPDRRWTLTITVLALSALHLVITKYLSERDGRRSVAYLLYAGLALTFATLAIPIRLEGRWITISWVVEGAVLVWSGFRARLSLMRYAGLLLFLITLFRLVAFSIPAERFLFNARFGVYAVIIGCFAFALWIARKNTTAIAETERSGYKALAVGLNFVTLTASSQEVYLLFSPGDGQAVTRQLELTRQLALTAFWSVYGGALFAGGLLGKLGKVRFQSYLLLAAVTLKFLVFDAPQAVALHYSPVLLNARFMCFAAMITSLVAVQLLARRKPEMLAGDEQLAMRVVGILSNAIAVFALSVEVWDFFQAPAEIPDDRGTGLARQLGLSLLWTAYAATLIVNGVRRMHPGLRYQALVLFAVTIGKVFFFDLGFLAGFYRIASSLALGVVLLVVAFLYQKFLTRQSAASSP